MQGFLLTLIVFPLALVASTLQAVTDAAQTAPDSGHCVVSVDDGDVQVWDCRPGFATGHDRLIFRAYGDGIPALITDGEYPLLNPGLDYGTVIFDAFADGIPNLVVVQRTDSDGRAIAEFYDDQDGDNQVSLQFLDNNIAEFAEPGPVVIIVASDGWLYDSEGNINFNLDILVDGPIRGTFGFYAEDMAPPDGSPDVKIVVRDIDQDGRPDHEVRQHLLDLAESAGYYRTEIAVNTEDDEHPIVDYLVTPFLSRTQVKQGSYHVKPSYSTSPAPIFVNWNESRITNFAELVTSRSNPGNYFIYSIARAEKGAEPSRLNFENPFAYYDLSDNHELIPNLLIRNPHFPANDPFFGVRLDLSASNDLSFTWRMPTAEPVISPLWDYKINLVGRHEYEHVEQIGEYSLYTANYSNFPTWVLSRVWDSAAFVADEDANIMNTEGISEWGAILEQNSPESYEYVWGERDDLILNSYRSISPGYRGEIAVDFDQEPLVYLSGFDRKLHLFNATEGIWRISESNVLRYWDLDADGYFDSWAAEQWHLDLTGEITGPIEVVERERLHFLAGYLLFEDRSGISILEAEYEPALLVAAPPSDTKTWYSLGSQLEALGSSDSTPDDLSTWLDDFSGPRSEVAGASFSNLRAIEKGFRFELTLETGFQFTGRDYLRVEGLAPGEYLLEYRDGTFSVSPLFPAEFRLEVRHPVGGSGLLQVPVIVSNTGTADAIGLTIIADVTDTEDGTREVARVPLKLFAGKSAEVFVDIPSMVAGSSVSIRVEDAEGRIVAAVDSVPQIVLDDATRDGIFSLDKAPVVIPVIGVASALVALAALLALSRREDSAL